MAKLNLVDNPFKVFTPEGMEAADANELFVPVPDFNKIRDPGHTMLNGPRGSGKSMIFRFLLPDCQLLQGQVSLQELPFFAVLVSIKNTTPNLTEFHRLDDQHAKIILNEHVLVTFVASKVFNWLVRMLRGSDEPAWRQTAEQFLQDAFLSRLRLAGWKGSDQQSVTEDLAGVFRTGEQICDTVYTDVNTYARRLAFPQHESVGYTGVLCDYVTFLYPLLKDLRTLPFMPNGPLYLLIDDADYLSHTQTRVLNSWIATRTQHDVSIKVSTQLRYKTFSTIDGMPVQSPHDYQEINIADIYTSRRSRYPDRVEQIVRKRLRKAGIDVEPGAFFPPDEKQEAAVRQLADELKRGWPETGRGYRPDDDVTRYARPEYIKRLGGPSKQTSTYSYAGFEQLVHISSGLVRYFLEPAAQMFDEEKALRGDAQVRAIRPGIQDDVIRREAETLMFTEFDKIAKEDKHEADDVGDPGGRETHQIRIQQLRNLIRALGGTFYQKLISDDSERRVFSVAVSGDAEPDVLQVFEMGVRYGYFHRSSIGNKDGTGRTRLYVLTRRLAPHFNLDPSSFAGYLWVTNAILREGMENPDRVLRKIKKTGVSQICDTGQLMLFE